MGTELAKAYVQIVPSADGIKGKILKALGGEASGAGESFGSKIVSTIKGVIAAAGIGKALSSTINEGAALQQSLGGIETLFKDSADKVKQNAANAYRTAGMSANEYMELTTSFSASLLSSLGNDTSKAADAADMAMRDMSDNANKMGTDMSSIQNAYQGFAKQNYTMLDNLKLGYGGTKTEMERLLKDAQKLTGVKYDINNLSDVYSAIHAVQEELDITGTTAKEASTTFSGSLTQMKAAFKNLLGNLSLGQDISGPLLDLQNTVHTFIIGNLFPMIGNVLSSLPELLDGAMAIVVRSLNIVSNNADQIVSQGAEFVTNLVSGIITNIPYFAEAALNIIVSLGNALLSADWTGITQNLITSIRSGLDIAAGEILGTDGNIVGSVMDTITKRLPDILNKGIELVVNISNGILQNLPHLITITGEVITEFVNKIISMLPTVLAAGTKLILKIVDGIINNIPQIISSAAKVISNFLSTIAKNLPQVLQSGITILGKLAAGLIQAIPNLVAKIPQIINSIKNEFTRVDWGSVGKNIISGIANGLRNAGSQLWNAVKGILGNFKDKVLAFFGIHSPATWGIFVGKMIDLGIANGLIKNLNPITDAVDEIGDEAMIPFNKGFEYTATGTYEMDGTGQNTGLLNRFDTLIRLLEIMIRSNKEIKIYLNNRETMRALEEMGVVFA